MSRTRHKNKRPKYKNKRPKKLNKSKKLSKSKRSKVMIGCSKQKCKKCGDNCKCGKNCNCPNFCPGDCDKHNIYGGSGCGNSGCPIAPLSIHGGGGQIPIPGPFVGQPIGTNINQLPGVDGIGGNRNYLGLNTNVDKNPSYQQSMNDSGYNTLNSKVGGYKYRGSRKKGGGLIPQDLVNLGRNFGFNAQSTYNTLNGYPAPINPSPFEDQLLRRI
jgi:hypothetical protein